MKILIVEDEKPAATRLMNMLRKAEPEATILGAVSYTHLDVYKRQGLCKGRPGEGWMATEKSIVRYNQDGSSKEIKLPSEMKDRVGSLLYDISGNLWVANGNKIFVANTRFEFTEPGISGIQAVAVSNNQIWLGCESRCV